MKKSILISQEYLLIPIKAEAETRLVSFYDGETKFLELAVPVSVFAAGAYDGPGKAAKEAYAFNFYASIPVWEWKGAEICIEGDVPENFLEAIAFSDGMPQVAQKRPLIHFSPNTGWLNDPNGLMYHDGVYHMFFQYNPCDTRWQNMIWGHAVSKDLLNWKQKEIALLPDADGTSAWSEGKKYVQKIAYSTDGNSFQKKEGCVLGHVAGDNRDPKVYWHEGKKLYYMALFLEGHDHAIFNSKDLEHWEMTQRITLERTMECPDLQQVPVEGGGSKWMFWGADGYYFLGDFDGSRFETDGAIHRAYQTMLPYAAQTFWGTDRVIMIPWMRTGNKGKVYTSLMGIPRQLTLAKKGEGFILRQKLVDEFEESKEKVLEQTLSGKTKDAAGPEASGELVFRQEDEAALEVKLFPKEGAGFKVDLYGTVCTMEPGGGRIIIEGVAKRRRDVKGYSALSFDKERSASEQTARKMLAVQGASLEGMDADVPKIIPGKTSKEEFWQIMKGIMEMPSWADAGIRVLEIGSDAESISFLSDGEILEITVDEGLVSDAYETGTDALCGEVKIKADGEVKVEIARMW